MGRARRGWEGRLGSRELRAREGGREGAAGGERASTWGGKEGSARAQDTLEDQSGTIQSKVPPLPSPRTSGGAEFAACRGSWQGAVGSVRGLMAPGQLASLILPGTLGSAHPSPYEVTAFRIEPHLCRAHSATCPEVALWAGGAGGAAALGPEPAHETQRPSILHSAPPGRTGCARSLPAVARGRLR